MASQEEIREVRLGKIKLLEKAGMVPYPAKVRRDFSLADVAGRFDELAKSHGSENKADKPIALAGRVMALRPQGGLIFFHLDDGTARFQGLLKKEEGSPAKFAELFDLFSQTVDIGDFIEVHGTLFVTKRGEKTLHVSDWRMLSKSLRALPEKWHGLQDVEGRFRHRYLDSLMSPEVKARFILRSKIISEIRRILDSDGYLEVETPQLQPLAGGANALPFKTHHNALDIDLFLRIAPELYLKKMLIGGFAKVYEIGRNFRNEGIDATHNPEFTMLEYYESYSDASKQMAFTEKMLKTLVMALFGREQIVHQGETIDFGKKFRVETFFDILKKYSPLENPEKTGLAEAEKVAENLGISLEKGDSLMNVFDKIYKKTARPKIIQPTFIVDYPVEYIPLAKRLASDPKKVDAFQLLIGGIEIVKAFSELNDPVDQAERFALQEKDRKAGNKEAQTTDREFLEAMEYGMPPAGGVGIGIDRLAMLLSDSRNIKEVIYFPTLRPEN